MPVSLFHRTNKKGINFHRHQLPVVTALNTPLDIEHSSWRCVRSKVGRRLVRRCQEVYKFTKRSFPKIVNFYWHLLPRYIVVRRTCPRGKKPIFPRTPRLRAARTHPRDATRLDPYRRGCTPKEIMRLLGSG